MADLFHNFQFRQIVHQAYTFVRSVDATDYVSGLTLDHLLQEHLVLLKKADTAPDKIETGGLNDMARGHASKWDRIDAMEALLTKAVDTVKNWAGDDPQRLSALGIYEVEQPGKDV